MDIGYQILPLAQNQLIGTSQSTNRSQEARNGTNHQPVTAKATAPAVTAQRMAWRNEAPLVDSRTAQTMIHPGIIVELHNSTTPATAPAANGRLQRAAQAAVNNPVTTASIAGQDP